MWGMGCCRTKTITMAQSLQLNHRSKIANFSQDSIHFPYFWKPLRGPTAGRAPQSRGSNHLIPPFAQIPYRNAKEISLWFRNTKSEPTWGKENTRKGETPAGMFYFGHTGTEKLSIFIYRGGFQWIFCVLFRMQFLKEFLFLRALKPPFRCNKIQRNGDKSVCLQHYIKIDKDLSLLK